MVAPARPQAADSYYGRPVLKAPVWKAWIPSYFFAGGLAAGSSLLALGGRLTGRRHLARRARLSALGAIGVGSLCLVADLGRPERFANMLRVAKPTSPMSVGSWLLALYGPAVGVAAATDVLGVLPAVGVAADVGAALVAPAVATYTGVLVADTAVPIWHEARAELPVLFTAGAAASAGGVSLLVNAAADSGPALRLATAGGLCELATWKVMEMRLGGLAEPYRQSRLSRVAEALTVMGTVAVLLPVRHRLRRLGAVLLVAGAALTRFVVAEGGKASAADPSYTVAPQRDRLEARPASAGHEQPQATA
jgi:DMSO reductase anchor subunit